MQTKLLRCQFVTTNEQFGGFVFLVFFYYFCLSFICGHPKRLPPIKSFFSVIFTICQLMLMFFHTKWVRQQRESTGDTLNIEKHL